MNIRILKKSIIKESSIFAAILLVLGGGVFFMLSVHDEYYQKKSKLDADANALSSQKTQLEGKYEFFQKNADLYKEIQAKTSSPGLYIDQESARSLFNIYRSQFYLSKLGLNMQPIIESTDAKLKTTDFVAITSEVSVPFEAITDEDVYELMRGLQKNLAGFTKFTSLRMKKTGTLDDAALRAIKSEGAHRLVEGELKFTWYGMKSLEPNTKDNRIIIKKIQRRRR